MSERDPSEPCLGELPPEPAAELLDGRPPVWQPSVKNASTAADAAMPGESVAHAAASAPTAARSWRRLPVILLAVAVITLAGLAARERWPGHESDAGPTVADVQRDLDELRAAHRTDQAAQAATTAEAFARFRTEQAVLNDMLAALSQQVTALDRRLTGQLASQARQVHEQDQRLNGLAAWQDDMKRRLTPHLHQPAPAKVVAATGTRVPRRTSPALRPPFELLSVDSWNLTSYAAIRPEGSREVKFVAVGERFAGWQFDAISLAGQSVDVFGQGVRLTVSVQR